MRQKIVLKLLAMATILVSFSCDKELENCYKTVCSGPGNTNCIEEPVANSGCFPNAES